MDMLRQTATALIIAVITFAGCKNTPANTMTMTTEKEDEAVFRPAI